jgi:hypothetical protein
MGGTASAFAKAMADRSVPSHFFLFLHDRKSQTASTLRLSQNVEHPTANPKKTFVISVPLW